MGQPTNYVEANALLALIRAECEEAMAALRLLTKTELYELKEAAAWLSEMCAEVIHREEFRRGGGVAAPGAEGGEPE